MTGHAYLTTLARFLATAGGAGYAPVAPGTWGTAVAVPLVWGLAGLPAWGFAIAALVVTAVGIWAAAVADASWGSHDSQRIVVDEVAGYMVTMIFVDRGDWVLLGLGFVLFRALDIVKPPPVRWLDENLPGGFGVVLDDVAAGVMGCVILYGLSLTGLPAWAHAAVGL